MKAILKISLVLILLAGFASCSTADKEPEDSGDGIDFRRSLVEQAVKPLGNGAATVVAVAQ